MRSFVAAALRLALTAARPIGVAGVLMAPVVAAQAQSAPPAVTTLERALASGNAEAAGRLFADRVELSLPGGSGVYSGAQATLVLGRFFDETPPQRFRFDHRMTAGGAVFASGRYDAEDGASMTVQVRLVADGSTWTVRALRIDPARLE